METRRVGTVRGRSSRSGSCSAARGSHQVLGWSGVWAWDPVENASLLPWLTGTAYIHSVLVQERRGMLRVWDQPARGHLRVDDPRHVPNAVGLQFGLDAGGDGPVGNWLSVFFGIVVVVSLGLIAWRGDRLRSPGSIDSPRRVRDCLANNVLFTVWAFVVLLGTLFPLLVEAIQDRQTLVVGSVLRPAVAADRVDAAVPDGCCAGAAVAQGIRRAVAQPSVLAGLGGRGGARDRRASSAPMVGRRWWHSASPGSPWGFSRFASPRLGNSPPGLARVRRPSQRRHGRAHRRDRDRRRAGRIEQLQTPGDARFARR